MQVSKSQIHRQRARGFTLLELLVVVGLIAGLSHFMIGGLAGRGGPASLQSAQAEITSLIAAARVKAMASGRSARILVNFDLSESVSSGARYLRYLAVQEQTAAGWRTVSGSFLPEGVYVVPGNFDGLPAGLFAPAPWIRGDGLALRSTALRANQRVSAAVNSPVTEEWVGITLAASAGTLQSGDLVLAFGRVRATASLLPGESPVELINPEAVRGVSLSAYGVPLPVNSRTSF